MSESCLFSFAFFYLFLSGPMDQDSTIKKILLTQAKE